MQQGNSAEGGAIDAIVELEMEVTATAKDGLGAVGEFGFVEASANDSLVCVEFLTQNAMPSASDVFALETVLPFASVRLLVWSLFHLKSFSQSRVGICSTPLNPQKSKGILSFSVISKKYPRRLRLVEG